MKASHDDRIARAAELMTTHPAARDLLAFYGEVALYQKRVYEELRSSEQTDVRALLKYFPALLELVRRTGPERLAKFGSEHLQARTDQQELLLTAWDGKRGDDRDAALSEAGQSEAGRFYARVLLQPYAEYLTS